MRWGVSVGIGLKVDDKFIGLITFYGALHALYHLLAHRGRIAGYRRCKRIDVTIGAAAIALGAVAVGTGKATIHDHFEHALPVVLFAQPGPVVVIAFDALL